MRTLVVVAGLITIAVTSSVASAQSVHVTVERAATATDQLNIARKYADEALRARNADDRLQAAANAAANFQAVRERAKKSRNLFVNAALLEADMYLSLNIPMSAKTLMEEIQAQYSEGPGSASVQLRLARALHRLHEDQKAESALRLAEARAKIDGPYAEFEATRELAEILSRNGKHAEAAERYRKLYRDLKDDPTHRAFFALKSAQSAVGAGDDAGARADLDAGDDFVLQARLKSKDAASARLQTGISDDLKRLRDQRKLH